LKDVDADPILARINRRLGRLQGEVHATAAVGFPIGQMLDPREQPRRDLPYAVGGSDQRSKLTVVKIGKGSDNQGMTRVDGRHAKGAY